MRALNGSFPSPALFPPSLRNPPATSRPDRVARDRDRQLAVDPRVDGAVNDRIAPWRVVVPVEAEHAVVERVVQPRAANRAAGSRLDVDHGRAWLVEAQPARLREPVAEVEILHVHPVALVEEAHLLQRLALDQHAGAVDRVDGPRL